MLMKQKRLDQHTYTCVMVHIANLVALPCLIIYIAVQYVAVLYCMAYFLVHSRAVSLYLLTSVL